MFQLLNDATGAATTAGASSSQSSLRDDDQSLVERIARGEAEALAQLYDRHGQLLLNLACTMLRGRAAAEDLVHDVFLEIWRKAHSYDPARASVQAWLVMRLRSRALDRLRSARVRREVGAADPFAHAPSLAARERADDTIDREALRQALATLPSSQKQVLELAYFHDLTGAEIAAVVGVPLGTVKSRMFAGMGKMRAALLPQEQKS